TVVGPLIDGPVYLSVSAIAPPVHPGPGGATAATHAVFSTASLQMGTSQVSFAFALSFFALPCPSCEPLMSHVTMVVLQESFVRSFTVPVTGSLASSVSLHVVLIGTGVDVPPTTTMSAMGTAVLLITVLLSVAVQLKSAVPPVFWMTYCTVSVSAGVCVPFTVKAFQPRHDAVPSSLLLTKPTSMNGPAPHLICLSTFTLHVSHVSFAVPVSVFWCPGLFGSTDPLISHVTLAVLHESFVS